MTCSRFEKEGLAALERGEKLDPHFAACADCLAARAAYERLATALATLATGAEPSPGWQARVRQRIAERAEKKSARWWYFALPAAATGLLAAILLNLPPAQGPALEVGIEPGSAPRRGPEAHPGDRLEISAQLAGRKFAELRLYLGDRDLLFACSDQLPCRRDGNRLTAGYVLPAVGAYQILLLTSDRPLPEGFAGSLDGDAGRATAAGAKVELETRRVR